MDETEDRVLDEDSTLRFVEFVQGVVRSGVVWVSTTAEGDIPSDGTAGYRRILVWSTADRTLDESTDRHGNVVPLRPSEMPWEEFRDLATAAGAIGQWIGADGSGVNLPAQMFVHVVDHALDVAGETPEDEWTASLARVIASLTPDFYL